MTQKKILVVDDEQDIIDFLTTQLSDHGYAICSAHDGLEAMQTIKQERPDLILLDLQMPEETGTGLFRKLRHKKELKDIPIIIISGLAGRHVAVSKHVPVIDKPFDDYQTVLDEVRRAIG